MSGGVRPGTYVDGEHHHDGGAQPVGACAGQDRLDSRRPSEPRIAPAANDSDGGNESAARGHMKACSEHRVDRHGSNKQRMHVIDRRRELFALRLRRRGRKPSDVAPDKSPALALIQRRANDSVNLSHRRRFEPR